MLPVIQEPELRQKLATAITILERLGIIDFNGHFSVRLADGNILINSGSSVRSKIHIEDFVIVDANGNYADDQPAPPAELPLHLALYQARPDIQSVVHGHPKWSTLLSSTGHDYRVVLPQGALLGEVPVYPSPMSINNLRIAGAIAKKLAQGRAALMRAHGSVVVGNDILETTVLAIYLELNSERQVRAASIGQPYIFSPEEVSSLREGLDKRGLFEKCWRYYQLKFGLDKQDQSNGT
jgi:L-fuculose-phosphate aldolase